MSDIQQEIDNEVTGLKGGITAAPGELEYSLSDVRSRLSEVEDTVERLERIPGRVDELEFELCQAKEETERVEEELGGSISTVEGGVDRLSRRIAALERHLRQAAGATVVDLDADPGGELHKLARTVEQGIAAQAQVLPDWQRAALEAPIGQFSRALEERGQHRRTVLRAAAVLASTEPGHPQREAAEFDFKAAAPMAQEAHRRIDLLRQKVAEARAQLQADDIARMRHGKAIKDGERADAKLRLRLRSRLSEAISGADLLPVWFTTVLGPLPPARNANVWMETATDLLAYRITYQVSDPVVALGGPPSPAASPRRRAWHQELTQELRRRG